MTIIEFRTNVIECILSRNISFKVEECNVTKNNGVILHGIIIKRENTNIFPTIYLESFFEEYKDGESIESISDRIIRIDERQQLGDRFDADFYDDFSAIKPRLLAKIINTEKNIELLKVVPSKSFLDLSIVVYCDVSDFCNMQALILVKNEHLKLWGRNAEEIVDIAICNTKKQGYEIADVVDALEAIGVPVNNLRNFGKGKMFVLRRKKSDNGAVFLIYDDILDEFINKNQNISGIYIIPSSIHEVLLIPDGDIDDSLCLNSMINTVNDESLSEEEILCGHAYHYSIESGYRIV